MGKYITTIETQNLKQKEFAIDLSLIFVSGSPLLTVRNRLPLKPILPFEEAVNPEFKVPKFTAEPQACGYSTEHRHGTNIPGKEN